MNKRLFIGSLPYTMQDKELRGLFERMGRVVHARVIFDKDTGKSRGFGFIEMSTAEEAERVMQKTIDLTVEGRKIVVKPAYESENSIRITSKQYNGLTNGAIPYIKQTRSK